MKRSERHRLKENELSHAFSEATAKLAERQRTFTLAGAAIIVVALVAGGYWAWHTRTETRAQVMLSDGVTIIQSHARTEAALQKFTQVANQYPSTQSGLAARYYAASSLSLLGRPSEAAARYQEVVDRAGTRNFYGRMAQLGVVEAQLQAKQYDQAIAKAQALANANDDSLPRDAMLMELGRAYAAAGKKTEAKQTFDKVLAEFPTSPLADEARALLTTVT